MAQVKAVSERTATTYRTLLLRGFGDLAPRQDAQLQPDVKRWKESSRGLLRAAVRWHWRLEGDEKLGARLAAKIPAGVKSATGARHPSEEDVRLFERAMKKLAARDRALLTVLVKLGLRASELLALEYGAVVAGAKSGIITVSGKGGKERELPCEHVAGALEQLLGTAEAPERVLHTGRLTGKPWKRLGQVLAGGAAKQVTQHCLLDRLVRKTAAVAGLDPRAWSPHKLRHAFATRMNRAGAPLPTLQAALGHTSLSATSVYTHPTAEDISRFVK